MIVSVRVRFLCSTCKKLDCVSTCKFISVLVFTVCKDSRILHWLNKLQVPIVKNQDGTQKIEAIILSANWIPDPYIRQLFLRVIFLTDNRDWTLIRKVIRYSISASNYKEATIRKEYEGQANKSTGTCKFIVQSCEQDSSESL